MVSPLFATIVCVLFISYLFQADRKRVTEGVSPATWVPFAWMFLAGSRTVSQWLNPSATLGSAEAFLDGSPLDRVVFLALIVLAILVLLRRNLEWKRIFRSNPWVLLFFLYGLLSVLWSDYPQVSFKRWIKALGNPLMAIVILTERRPLEALGLILRRLSFVLLPLSILFIKFYPHLGRAYHIGRPLLTGVAMGKNGLGQICLIVGMYYCWDLLFGRNSAVDSKRPPRLPIYYYVLILTMIVWLLRMADSATSTLTLIVAVAVMVVGRVPAVSAKPGRIIRIGLSIALVVTVLEITVHLSEAVIEILGRDPTLTTRVPMWQGLLDMAENPAVGVGYESFWLGNRLTILLELYGVRQAHNGYLETYLNLGLVGLLLCVGQIASGLFPGKRQLIADYRFALLRLTFVVAVAAYNWTEATFYGVSNMWLLLFVGILDVRKRPLPVDLAESDSSAGHQQVSGAFPV